MLTAEGAAGGAGRGVRAFCAVAAAALARPARGNRRSDPTPNTPCGKARLHADERPSIYRGAGLREKVGDAPTPADADRCGEKLAKTMHAH